MLNSAENSVKIEGILSEIDLKYGSYVKNGATIEDITGSIKVRVSQKLNGEDVELDIPVYMFANKLTGKGKPNPAYESIERVMKEYVSIAAGGIEAADRVRITNATIRSNEYYTPSGMLNSYPRINASFVNKVTDLTKFSPEASFSIVFMIGASDYDKDKNGDVIPNRYKIRGIVPQYGGKVDVIDFYAINPGVINAVSTYWQQNDTVKINGKLNFTSRVEEKEIPVDFGEPKIEKRTISISELVITGGTQSPLSGEFAFDPDEIKVALEERQAHLAELKEKAASKANTTKATKTKTVNSFDLGF